MASASSSGSGASLSVDGGDGAPPAVVAAPAAAGVTGLAFVVSARGGAGSSAGSEAELVAPSFELSVEEAAARLEELRADLPDALTARIRPFSGVRGALEAAHARGLKLAVLSDYDAEEKLENLGLADLPWTAKVSAERCGALKPNPEPFQVLSQRLGVLPSEIVHVGDREDVDVAGALSCGLRAWHLTSKRGQSTRAEHQFAKYKLDTFAPLWGSSS